MLLLPFQRGTCFTLLSLSWVNAERSVRQTLSLQPSFRVNFLEVKMKSFKHKADIVAKGPSAYGDTVYRDFPTTVTVSSPQNGSTLH